MLSRYSKSDMSSRYSTPLTCKMNDIKFLWIANSCPDVQYHTLNMPSLDVIF